MTRRGQATTEYVLLIAVLVVGVVAAAYAFVPLFDEGMDGLDDDAGSLFEQGTRAGSGDVR